jgi:hypothetical protein
VGLLAAELLQEQRFCDLPFSFDGRWREPEYRAGFDHAQIAKTPEFHDACEPGILCSEAFQSLVESQDFLGFVAHNGSLLELT